MFHSYTSITDEPGTSVHHDDDDPVEADGDGETKHYYHKNSESPGYIIFTVSCS